jgi:asparagine synthetase B (glutamine-hydrolysing)
MCGIIAVVTLDSVKSSTLNDPYYRTWLRQSLNESLATIQHRPDARSQWISDNCCIGMNDEFGFAINDPTRAGEKPFHDKDGVIHAVVNGEFYEYQRSKSSQIYAASLALFQPRAIFFTARTTPFCLPLVHVSSHTLPNAPPLICLSCF